MQRQRQSRHVTRGNLLSQWHNRRARERERAGEKVMKREEDQEMGEERVGGGEEAGGKCPHSAAFRVRDVK